MFNNKLKNIDINKIQANEKISQELFLMKKKLKN